MPDDAVAYLLLALDLLVVAAILTAPLLVLLWLAGRRRPRAPRRDADGRRLSKRRREELDVRADVDKRVLRRCEACSTLWKGRAGHRVGRSSLWVRRWVRRRSRDRKRPAPMWAERQGYSRCPSCLSTQVRTSSAAGRRH